MKTNIVELMNTSYPSRVERVIYLLQPWSTIMATISSGSILPVSSQPLSICKTATDQKMNTRKITTIPLTKSTGQSLYELKRLLLVFSFTSFFFLLFPVNMRLVLKLFAPKVSTFRRIYHLSPEPLLLLAFNFMDCRGRTKLTYYLEAMNEQ